MLDVCFSFAAEVGLQISVDQNPASSKSKAVFVVGCKTDLEKLLLSDKALPYVAHATHLGHELHEDGTMTMDTSMRRGTLIDKTLEVKEAFSCRPRRARRGPWDNKAILQ